MLKLKNEYGLTVHVTFSFNISHLMPAGHTLQKFYYSLLHVCTVFIHFFTESAVTMWPCFYPNFIFLSLNSQHVEKVFITSSFLEDSSLHFFNTHYLLGFLRSLSFCLLIFTLPFDDCIYFSDFDYMSAKVFSWTSDLLHNSTQMSHWQHIYIWLKTQCFLCIPDLCQVLLCHQEHDPRHSTTSTSNHELLCNYVLCKSWIKPLLPVCSHQTLSSIF